MDKRRRLFIAVLVLLLLLLSEAVAYLGCRFLRRRGIFYRPVVADYDEYMRLRDPVLGWPSKSRFGGEKFDASGARPSPAYPDPNAEPLVALYGDSFTWGDQVDHEHAWGNRLARELGGRVDNFGVGGYGSDQALLRFRQHVSNGRARAPVVVLCHLSENILRNVNRFRDLLYPGAGMGFTPRFLPGEDGRPQPVPLPRFADAEDYRQTVLQPEAHLAHEYFVPGGPGGVSRMRFPYTLSLLRGTNHFYLRARWRGEPWYADFYRPDHPAGGLAVTAAILESFHDQATETGRLPVVIVLPTGLDLEHYLAHARWTYRPLLDEMEKRGMPVLNAGPPLLAKMSGRTLASFYVDAHPGAHFNADGNRVLAEVVAAHLRTTARHPGDDAP